MQRHVLRNRSITRRKPLAREDEPLTPAEQRIIRAIRKERQQLASDGYTPQHGGGYMDARGRFATFHVEGESVVRVVQDRRTRTRKTLNV